jgi:E3 ubiquitin-protein ligase HECTD2
MVPRDLSPHSAGPNDSGKDKDKDEEYFDTHYSSERRQHDPAEFKRSEAIRNLFKPVEEYIITSFGSYESLNSSFSTLRPSMTPRAASEGSKRNLFSRPVEKPMGNDETLSELDAKTLLLGDFAENGSWWTGGREAKSPERSRTHRAGDLSFDGFVTIKSPRIDWGDLNEWYHLVLNAGRSWQRRLDNLIVSELHTSPMCRPSDREMEEMEGQIMEAQFHAQRVLLKATESLLKRPGRPLREPEDLRFLLIILANPLLYPSHGELGASQQTRSKSRGRDTKSPYKPAGHDASRRNVQSPSPAPSNTNKGSSGQHSGIIKRVLGLLSNVPNECHHHLVSWFARYSDSQFHRIADLIGSFVTYRLTRQHGKRREANQDPTAGLIPDMSGSGRSTSAALHAALGITGQPSQKSDGKPQPVIYNDDWQIKAAARVMALIFSANNSGPSRRGEIRPPATIDIGHSAGLAARERAHIHGQILPTSDFYNTLLDYSDLVADFEAWEARRGKFAFCQYPFFLSIWAKIQIMEYDARRQMEVKAREAFFDSIMTRKTVNQYLVLKIRRDCLVEDSLKGVSEVVGSGGEEIKKGLRIEFKGEEGIDAGGLRKEWFLLLVRDVFNPDHGQLLHLILAPNL